MFDLQFSSDAVVNGNNHVSVQALWDNLRASIQEIKHEIFGLQTQLRVSKYTFPREEGYVFSKPLLEQLLAKQQELFAAQSGVVDALRESWWKRAHFLDAQMEFNAIMKEDRVAYQTLMGIQKDINNTQRRLDACRHMTKKELRAMRDQRRRDRRMMQTFFGACLKLEMHLAELESGKKQRR